MAVATGAAAIHLDDSPAFRKKLEPKRRTARRLIANGEVIYGVTTGFGALLRNIRSPGPFRENGRPTSSAFTAAAPAAFSTKPKPPPSWSSASSASPRAAPAFARCCWNAYAHLINRRILPQIPAEGSVGASGDLTPLSYIAAVLIGEREVSFDGQVMPAADALPKPPASSPSSFAPRKAWP